MKNCKKLLALVLALACVLCAAIGFSACSGGDGQNDAPSHTHTFEDTWTADANGHYKKSTCSHPDSETLIKHSDGNNDKKCDVCDYVLEPDDGAIIYTVTVLDNNGNPVAGAEVTLVQFSGSSVATTDRYGRATFDVLNTAYVAARVTKVPAGYLLPSGTVDTVFAAGVTTMTFNDIEKLIEYTFVVEDTNGYGVEGAEVQICTGEDCRPGTTDKNGLFTTYISAEKARTEGVKAKINSLPAGYVNPEGAGVAFEYVIYDENETLAVATVAEFSSYTVTVGDLFGELYDGVTVELYNAGGVLVDTKTTDSYGFCEFFVNPGVYTVNVAHPNAAFSWTNKDFNTLTADNSSYFATLIESKDPVSYEFKLADTAGNVPENVSAVIFSADGKKLAVCAVNEAGEASLYLANSDYIVIFDDSEGAYLVLDVKRNGPSSYELVFDSSITPGSSKDNAISALSVANSTADDEELADLAVNSAMTVAQGASIWIKVPFARRRTITFDATKFDVEYDGKAVEVVDGKASVTFDTPLGASAYVKVSAIVESALNPELVFDGTSENRPTKLSEGAVDGYETTISMLAGEVAYFEAACFTVNGVLSVSATADAFVTIDGGASVRPVFGKSALVRVEVFEDAEVTVSFSYSVVKYDYKVIVVSADDNFDLSGIGITIYEYSNDEYVEIATGVTDTNGEITFSELYLSENYYVAITHANLVKDYVKIETVDDATVIFATHVKDGTLAYPYGTELGENSLNFAEAGTIWYDLSIVGTANYTFTAPSGVSYTVYANVDGTYVALSTEGEHTYSAYGIEQEEGGALKFTDNGIFRFEFVADGAVDTAFTFVSNAKSKDNAITVSEAGTVSIAVVDGETDYYLLAFEGNVTVRVHGNAALSIVTVTELGEITENVDSTYTVTVSGTDLIYFRLSSQVDGDYEVTITVE